MYIEKWTGRFKTKMLAEVISGWESYKDFTWSFVAYLYFLTFLQQKCSTFIDKTNNKRHKWCDPNGIPIDPNHIKYSLFIITWKKMEKSLLGKY